MSMYEWTLGEGLGMADSLLDRITFEDIAVSASLNSRVLDGDAVKGAAYSLLESRIRDFNYLLENNIDELVREAEKRRWGNA